MDKHWYLVCGDLEEMLIVYSTEDEVEELAEQYVVDSEYAIFSISDPNVGVGLINCRSKEPPYLPQLIEYH